VLNTVSGFTPVQYTGNTMQCGSHTRG